MRDRKLRQLNILTLIAVGVAVLCIAVFAFMLSPAKQGRLGKDSLTAINDRWVLKNYNGGTDELISLPVDLDADAGDTITIMSQVPDDVSASSVLMFYTEFQNVVVTIGEDRVYSNGVMNNQKFMKNAVPCYNVVSLEKAEPGDVITIYLSSAYSHYSGRLGSIYYGTGGSAVTSLIRHYGISFMCGVTLLVITLLLIISLITLRGVNVNKSKAGYGYGFVLTAVLWMLSANPVMQVITGNSFGVYMAGAILLLVMPILYLMYQSLFAYNRRMARIYEIGIYIYSINMLVGIVFQLLSVCDFAIYIIPSKLLILLGLIMLVLFMYLSGAYREAEHKGSFAANVVLLSGALLETLFSMFDFYETYDGIILQAGLYVFVITLVIYVEKTVIGEMNREKNIAVNSIESEKEKAVKNINTSFIYGALNQAMTEIKDKDRDSSRLIYDASIYMKNNIETLTCQGIVPFSKELEYIKAYLGIQYRRNNDLEVMVEDKVVDFAVPFDTIEPLVENAVVNGAKTSLTAGRIVVRSYERLDCYAIQIVDNGKGIGPDRKFTGRQSYKTIKKRLKSMCGAVVEVKSKPDKGTILTIKIPKEGYIIKE